MGWVRSMAILLGFTLVMSVRAGDAAAGTGEAGAGSWEAEKPVRILVFGDSLSAEYGLPRGTGWVSHVERRLAKRKKAYQIRNASISGDTTTGGLQRLHQTLADFHPDIVILQLGANDGLRGLPVPAMKDNLRRMIDMCRAGGADVLLVGQQIPPNYGRRHAETFRQAYIDLAAETGVALVPFMLDGIAADTSYFQADGLHPTVEAQPLIADTVWPYLERLLD